MCVYASGILYIYTYLLRGIFRAYLVGMLCTSSRLCRLGLAHRDLCQSRCTLELQVIGKFWADVPLGCMGLGVSQVFGSRVSYSVIGFGFGACRVYGLGFGFYWNAKPLCDPETHRRNDGLTCFHMNADGMNCPSSTPHPP